MQSQLSQNSAAAIDLLKKFQPELILSPQSKAYNYIPSKILGAWRLRVTVTCIFAIS